MMRPEPDSPEAELRSEAAADWLVRRDRGLTAAEQDEFLQWLAADPRHGEWLALHRHVVGDFGALAQWRPEHSEEPNPDLFAPPRRRIRWRAPVALAAAASIAVALGLWWRATPAAPSVPMAITKNEPERRILEDGSAVELNSGAVVTTTFSDTVRRATLVRGEALFTVTKNPARPFIVSAGGVDVRAVGTAFSVRLDSAAVEVLVTEGRVSVAQPVPENQKKIGAPAAEPALIDAGQHATVSRTSSAPPTIVALTPAQSARLLAWQPQLLDFSSAPLSSAIAEFNRRNRLQFVLADPALAPLPIVASIRSDNVEGFVRFLSAIPGVQIERRGESEIIVRQRP